MLLLVIAGLAGPARAALSFSSGLLGLAVPDALDSGVASTLVLPPLAGTVTDVKVSVSLSPRGAGTWNGDLYLALVHEGSQAVLLNRPGRTLVNEFGYSDAGGLAVTFADSAADDIHRYRLALTGGEEVPLPAPGQVTGLWQPDARSADPLTVTDGSARMAWLSVFAGQEAAGAWTLFVADLSTGGLTQLDHWTLELSGISPIPEPTYVVLVVALGLAGFAGFRCRRRSVPRPSPAAGAVGRRTMALTGDTEAQREPPGGT